MSRLPPVPIERGNENTNEVKTARTQPSSLFIKQNLIKSDSEPSPQTVPSVIHYRQTPSVSLQTVTFASPIGFKKEPGPQNTFSKTAT